MTTFPSPTYQSITIVGGAGANDFSPADVTSPGGPTESLATWVSYLAGATNPNTMILSRTGPFTITDQPFFKATTIQAAPLIAGSGSVASPNGGPAAGVVSLMWTEGLSGSDFSSGAPIVGLTILGGSAPSGAGARAGFFQVVDNLGNPTLPTGTPLNFTEGVRIHSISGAGVNYTNTEGGVSVAIGPLGPLDYAHIIGWETQVDNLSGDAPVMDNFLPNHYAAGYVSSIGEPSGGTYFKIDAGFMLNPYNSTKAQTGFFAPAGTVGDTAFGVMDTCAYGLRAEEVTFAVVSGPNATALLRAKTADGTQKATILSFDASNIIQIGNDSHVVSVNIVKPLTLPSLNFAQTAATTATTGSATLPAQPVGFLNIELNGSAVKIPYYSS